MCENKDCQHKKESPIKNWKHRCKYGPDGKRLQNGTVISGWNDMATTHPFLAQECLSNSAAYLAGTNKILFWKCRRCGHEYPKKGCERVQGKGCGCCSNQYVVPGINDMATTHPSLAEECLDDPTKHIAGTTKTLRWKCRKCGHEYPKSGCQRVFGYRCGCCTNSYVVVGINDMATTRPDMARELLGDPTKYVAGTHSLLRWRCGVCGYKWPATGAQRSRLKAGCRCCSNKIVVPGINDMATTHPDLAKECLSDPKAHIAGTSKTLDWKCCKCGKEWPATGANRASKKNACGCPNCTKYGHNQSKPSFVYLICRPGQIQYGIMNTWTNRLKQHARKGWELLDKIEVTGRKARSLETKIKQTLRAKGIPTGREAFREKFEGSTEAFQEVDLYVRSIRGLCRKLGIDLDAFLAA